ncbi:hypothetical protein Sjap_020000 [Stephania japonica]|uniref:Nucleoside phosphorylase domain-containing protein n=1 Tax=Stephania japonica TaxID=461633 RepID=A0AAP0F1A2_9MAGN
MRMSSKPPPLFSSLILIPSFQTLCQLKVGRMVVCSAKVFSWGFVMVMMMMMVVVFSNGVEGVVTEEAIREIRKINKEGPYLGLVVPNSFELGPLLESPVFVPHQHLPFMDFSGRRFRIGKLKNEKVIVVMTGLGMLNAGLATELLLSLFKVKGVLHFGIAGNANPNLQIGDVVIPQHWAHTGLWNWQRYGDGAKDELAFEANGDYTRQIGYINISKYSNVTNGGLSTNLLNNIWYQPEEIFPVDGEPEIRQHAFWVPVENHYFEVAKNIKGLKLESCVNFSTCLPRKPMVVTVEKGCSASVLVDNAAYRSFLHSKFNVTPIDMESASVALVSHKHRIPFIAFRALSDLAGGGSSSSNEAAIFGSLAAQNAVQVLVRFIALLFA